MHGDNRLCLAGMFHYPYNPVVRFMEYHPNSYFKANTQYLVKHVCRYLVCECVFENGYWWFSFPGMYTKAITCQCAELSELAGRKLKHKGDSTITGVIVGHTALTNTPFLYVFWDMIPSNKPRPCSCLPDINELTVEGFPPFF